MASVGIFSKLHTEVVFGVNICLYLTLLGVFYILGLFTPEE
jgi:hypothetical protein